MMDWVYATWNDEDGHLYDEMGFALLAGNPKFESAEEANDWCVEHDLRITVR